MRSATFETGIQLRQIGHWMFRLYKKWIGIIDIVVSSPAEAIFTY
jgi:hypothetical protein